LSDDNVIAFPAPEEGAPVGRGPEELVHAVEALLFAAGEPVTHKELVAALEVESAADVREALHTLAGHYMNRGIRLLKVAGGWQFRTDPRFADEVLALRGGKPAKMSKAALEALSVIAYRQPTTRSEVDEIRGVGSGGVIKTLLDKGYVRVMGRRDEPGRPLEYGTTTLFLEMFQLQGLDGLPTLREREELAREEEGEDPIA